MSQFFQKLKLSRLTLALLLISCSFCLIIFMVITFTDTKNSLRPFAEPCEEIKDGWTLTDSTGNAKSISLPLILEYGSDGRYSLETILPSDLDVIGTPTLEFYSNYLDVNIILDGESVYSYPYAEKKYSPGTGNTYHYIRLSDYKGKHLKIELNCQLGDTITYSLEPVKIGSKATMLYETIKDSLYIIIIASCMCVLGIVLFSAYLSLRKNLNLDRTTLYLAFFSIIFVFYISLESLLAKVVGSNPYLLYTGTYMALALMPLPLIAMFKIEIDKRYRPIAFAVLLICFLNFFIQTILHFTNTVNYRALMPITHGTIIFTMAVMLVLLMLTGKKYGKLKLKYLTIFPLIIGGCVDILLLSINKPSLNNNFYFVIGVTLFIVMQFIDFTIAYFTTYRLAIESGVLREMAYFDSLSQLKNRNAFENKIKSLSGEQPHALACIVADIDRMKEINDTLGHEAGDRAIKETGSLITELFGNGAGFRTGGDEFIIFTEGSTEVEVKELVCSLTERLAQTGKELSIPIKLSAGYGCYEAADGDIQGFIRRVDNLMYLNKRVSKE